MRDVESVRKPVALPFDTVTIILPCHHHVIVVIIVILVIISSKIFIPIFIIAGFRGSSGRWWRGVRHPKASSTV